MADSVAQAGSARRFFARLAEALVGFAGWRRYLAAAILGALASAALPPTHIVPALWPAFVGLLWLLDGVRRPHVAFLVGWAFGTGHFFAGLYWVGIAFLVDAEQFAALIPLAVGTLSAGIGLFPGLAVLAVWSSRCTGLGRVLLLAAAWVATEWLRSWVLTGFPWNLIGSVWTFSDAMLQLGALAGVWGLSLVTVLAAAAPASLGDPTAPSLARWTPTCIGVLALTLVWSGGALRLAGAPVPGDDTVPGVMLRLVQPNIDQSGKWEAERRRQNIVDQMTMSIGKGGGDITHVVWSETAITYSLEDDPALRRALARIVPPGGLLLSGSMRRSSSAGRPRLWNSLHALDPSGEIRGTYDKFHLVPFGEYVPFRSVFDFSKLTQGRMDFSAGPGPRTLELPGLPPVGPLICYEVIFPGRVTEPGRRPAWLLNVTNDAWFGISSGPYQHFASVRLRAVEEGLPAVRAANTGISAVVDSYGRVLHRLGLDRAGVIDSPLPRPAEARTLYSRIGNWLVPILIAIFAAPAFVLRIRYNS
jgi:apolipoprotein N-acyltransferase